MKSAFLGFNIATQGLFTARAALNTTNHNIANANTVGYSRQVVEQKATRPLATGTGKGMIGTGSEVVGIDQIRDFYLDVKYWSENNVLGQYSIKEEMMTQIEALFNEPSDSGFNTVFNNFFDSLQTLSTSAGDDAYREQVKQMGAQFAQYFNTTSEQLQDFQRDMNFAVKSKVDEINSIASQIQRLNQQIFNFEIDGSKANDLRDQRANLVDQLSKIVNVEVEEVEMNPEAREGEVYLPQDRHKSQKQFIVKINGQVLVEHYQVNELTTKVRTVKSNPEDVDGLYDIQWKNGLDFDTSSPTLSGELKGYLDMRDGNNLSAFKATLDSISTNTEGVIQLAYVDANREDIEAFGNLEIDDKTVAYGVDPATGNITIPPLKGEIQIGAKAFAYDGVVNYNPPAQMQLQLPKDLDPAEFLNPGTIRIGNQNIDATNIMYDNTTGILTISANRLPTASEFKVGSTLNIGEDVNFKGIPHYIRRLNEFVRTFARAVNEGEDGEGESLGNAGHIDGYGSNGNTGNYLFTYDGIGKDDLTGGLNYNEITAANFSLSKEVLEDARNIAASTTANPGEGDNELLLQLISVKHNSTLFRQGEPGNFIEAIISEMGIDSKQAQQFAENQTNITKSIENQRMSVSGVNIDEEMSNMIKFQQAYNAAAKMITVIDEIYDTTINLVRG